MNNDLIEDSNKRELKTNMLKTKILSNSEELPVIIGEIMKLLYDNE